jgi:hypothetical protein
VSALILLGPAAALLLLAVLAAAYQPAQPPQCPLHYDCATPEACTAVLLQRAADAGYPHGFTTGRAA